MAGACSVWRWHGVERAESRPGAVWVGLQVQGCRDGVPGAGALLRGFQGQSARTGAFLALAAVPGWRLGARNRALGRFCGGLQVQGCRDGVPGAGARLVRLQADLPVMPAGAVGGKVRIAGRVWRNQPAAPLRFKAAGAEQWRVRCEPDRPA